jgi:hypothetical protein
VRVLDLAAQGDLGIDRAVLVPQVAPILATYTNMILTEADAYVRGGTNASLNFGTSTTLDIKADTSANTHRQAYLRWNLTGYPSNFVPARIRLTPTSVGTNGSEHAITLTTSTQPGSGTRFATWIPTANIPVKFIITPQAQAAQSVDSWLSLELFSLSYVGGDGVVNLTEFISGTIPSNSTSTFGLTAIDAENSALRITWMTGAGKTNALQVINGAGYTNAFSDIYSVTNTTGPATDYLDTGALTNRPNRYYRVRLVP